MSSRFKRPCLARAHLDTATAGPRTVPVRSGLSGVKTLEFSGPPRPSDVLRSGTARAPVVVSRCARLAFADSNLDSRIGVQHAVNPVNPVNLQSTAVGGSRLRFHTVGVTRDVLRQGSTNHARRVREPNRNFRLCIAPSGGVSTRMHYQLFEMRERRITAFGSWLITGTGYLFSGWPELRWSSSFSLFRRRTIWPDTLKRELQRRDGLNTSRTGWFLTIQKKPSAKSWTVVS